MYGNLKIGPTLNSIGCAIIRRQRTTAREGHPFPDQHDPVEQALSAKLGLEKLGADVVMVEEIYSESYGSRI